MGTLFKKIQKRFGKGLTFMMIPNSSSAVRSFSVPFPLLLVIVGIVIFNILIFALFTTQVGQLAQYRKQIWKKDKQIVQLRKEQKEIQPALRKSYQIAEELSRLKTERAQLINTWKSIQQKGGRTLGTTNRGAMIRTRGYEIQESVAQTEEKTTLKKLNQNLDQIDKFIAQESNAQDILLKDLKAYEIKLDHMPSKWPVFSRWITSWFGNRFHPKYHRYRQHTGVDIKVTYGSKVYAAGDGIVSYAGYKRGYGYTVMINHGYGYQTLYGHNSKIVVKAGSRVKKGTLICYSGNSGTSTGPHLHYEVLVDGKPANPALFLKN